MVSSKYPESQHLTPKFFSAQTSHYRKLKEISHEFRFRVLAKLKAMAFVQL